MVLNSQIPGPAPAVPVLEIAIAFLVIFEVPFHHERAPADQFADGAGRNWIAVFVRDPDIDARSRPPNGSFAGFIFPRLQECQRAGFRLSVMICVIAMRQAGATLLNQSLRCQRAAGADVFQAGETLHIEGISFEQIAHLHRDHEHGTDTMFLGLFDEGAGVPFTENNGGTAGKDRRLVPDHQADCMKHRRQDAGDVFAGNPVFQCRRPGGYIPRIVADHSALGLARSAAGKGHRHGPGWIDLDTGIGGRMFLAGLVEITADNEHPFNRGQPVT